MRAAVATLASILFASSASAQAPVAPVPKEIKGQAGVLSGDTIRIRQDDVVYEIRLWGISAPEMGSWGMAPWARAKLDDMVREKVVSCEVVVERDADGRPAARCGTEADPDLGQVMLLTGLAVVDRASTIGSGSYGDAFDEAEAIARRGGRGVWSTTPAGFDG